MRAISAGGTLREYRWLKYRASSASRKLREGVALPGCWVYAVVPAASGRNSCEGRQSAFDRGIDLVGGRYGWLMGAECSLFVSDSEGQVVGSNGRRFNKPEVGT
jgi:hypothetical protein